MKKTVLFAALALAAAGSWAFYPKAQEPGGYMMIISNPSRGAGTGVTITTVAPDGAQQEHTTKIKSSMFTPRAVDEVEMHRVELAVLNEHSRAGWHLVNVLHTVTADKGTTGGYQTVYLLEKR